MPVPQDRPRCRTTSSPRRGRHGAPQEDPGKANVDDRALLDLNRARVLHVDADVTVVRQREPAQVVVACAHDGDALHEVVDRAVLDRDPVVAGDVVDAGALALAGNCVAVQIERDVVRADRDPGAAALRQVAVERRIGGDRLATADMVGLRRVGAWRERQRERGRRQQHPDELGSEHGATVRTRRPPGIGASTEPA
jgi:hypothetical protein